MSRWLALVPRALGHPLNIGLGLLLLLVLVGLPVAGLRVPDAAELIGGNFMNAVGYLGASIAAGASVANLHEHRTTRRHVSARLDALHAHLTAPADEEAPQ